MTRRARLQKMIRGALSILVALTMVLWQTPALAAGDSPDATGGAANSPQATAQTDSGDDTKANGQEPAADTAPSAKDEAATGSASQQPKDEGAKPASGQAAQANAQNAQQAGGQSGSTDSTQPSAKDAPTASGGSDEDEVTEPEEEKDVWNILFDANGGQVPEGSEVRDITNVREDGDAVKLPKGPFEREGYSFVGWNTVSDPDDPNLDPEEENFVPDGVKLSNLSYSYVVLTEDNATEQELEDAVTTSSGESIKVVTGKEAEDETDAEGRTVHTCDLRSCLSGDTLTLYAQWQEDPEEQPEVDEQSEDANGEASDLDLQALALQAQDDGRSLEVGTINNALFANVSADGGTEALTGQTMYALFYAFNDNPNATALTKIRVYVAQPTLQGDYARVAPVYDNEVIEMYGAVGNEATTIKGTWHIVDEGAEGQVDGANAGSPTVAYLELELPAGASIAERIPLLTASGRDEEVKASVYVKYQPEGSEEWADPANEEGAETPVFTWTGNFGWSNFQKKGPADPLIIEGGKIAEDSIAYTFSVENSNMQKTVGVLLTSKLELEDTLTLPAGLSIPEGYTVDASAGMISKDETAVVALNLANDIKENATIDSMQVDEARQVVTVKLTVANPGDGPGDAFNPISGISMQVNPSALEVDQANLPAEAKVNNAATVTVTSVNDGKTENTESFTGESETAFPVSVNAVKGLAKRVVSVYDVSGTKTVDSREVDGGWELFAVDSDKASEVLIDGVPVIKNGYKVSYEIEVVAENSEAIMVTDEMSPALLLMSGTAKYRVNDGELSEPTVKTTTGSTVNTTKFTIPAGVANEGDKVYITYDCIVDTAKLADSSTYSTLTNKAKCGDYEVEVPVRTPDPGTLTFTKEIATRYSVSPTGSSFTIWREKGENGNVTYKWSGDRSWMITNLGAPEGSDFSQDQLKKGLNQMAPGDYLEYLLTVDNQSGVNETGSIYDYSPFQSNYNMYGAGGSRNLEAKGQAVGKPAESGSVADWQGYEYQVTGVKESGGGGGYLPRLNGRYMPQGMNSHAMLDGRVYGDLSAQSTLNSDSFGFSWSFDAGNPVRSYTTYYQTMLVKVPGDSTRAMTWTERNNSYPTTYRPTRLGGNTDYQDLLAKYEAYQNSYRKGSFTSEFEYKPYAYAAFNRTKGTYLRTGYILHTVLGEVHINTGVAATSSNASVSGRPGNWYLSSSGNSVRAYTSYVEGNHDADLHTFANSDKTVVVNYVYIFNDSDEPMDLSKYNISLSLPSGFDWVGFVYPTGQQSGSSVYYDSDGKTRYWAFSGSSSEYFYNSNLISYSSSNSSQPAHGAYNGPLYAFNWACVGYEGAYLTPYANQINSSSGSSVINDDRSLYGNTGNSAYGVTLRYNAGTLSLARSSSKTIPANSGMTIYYAAKFDPAYANAYPLDESRATFGAYLNRIDGGMLPPASTKISAERYLGGVYSEDGTYEYYNMNADERPYSNNGVMNSYRDYDNPSHNHYQFATQGNDMRYSGLNNATGSYVGGSPSSAWSFVSLQMERNEVSLSVEKEALKNSGDDGDGAGGLEYAEAPEDGYNTDYDDYNYHYILDDGIHRTVDGTVTWKMNVSNTGTKAAVGHIYDELNYGTLVETIDTPYDLVEIYVPTLPYMKVSGGNANAGVTYDEVRIGLKNASWTEHADGIATYQTTLGDVSGTAGGPADVPVRITRQTLSGASLGWGYDVGTGDRNVDATQYIVEFGSAVVDGMAIAPILALEDNSGNFASSVDLYMTFATTDSIETNYNSFGVYLPTTQDITISNDARLITAGAAHASTSAVSGDEGSDATSQAANAAPQSAPGTMNAASDEGGLAAQAVTPPVDATGDFSLPLGGDYGVLATDAKFVEHSDWTDTSYTDGVKTVGKIMGERQHDGTWQGPWIDTRGGGNAREEGEQTLSHVITPGTTFDVQLAVESILYESENYDFFENLNIYDVWGIEEGVEGAGTNWFTPIFDTMEVWDNHGNTLVFGTDYKIYYTTEHLQTVEHHPIAPVNTLYYAADISKIGSNSVEWTEWNEGDELPEGVAGLRVQILPDSDYAKVYNTRMHSGEKTAYADYRINVDVQMMLSEDAPTGEKFPDVEAWSARVHDKDTGELKEFIEDTTEAFIKSSDKVEATLTKTVVNENGDDVSNLVADDAEFTYLLARGGSAGYNLQNPIFNIPYEGGHSSTYTYLEAVGLLTVHAGENVDLLQLGSNPNFTMVYANSYVNPVVTADNFFQSGKHFYIAELDSTTPVGYAQAVPTYNPAYEYQEFVVDQTNVDQYKIGRVRAYVSSSASSRYDHADVILADAPDWLKPIMTPADSLNTHSGGLYFWTASNNTNWTMNAQNVNTYKTSDVVINKLDADTGETIAGQVKFQLLNENEEPVQFTTDDQKTYKFAPQGGDGATSDIVLSKQATLTGLVAGQYKLVETAAPTGYDISDPVDVTVVAGERPDDVTVDFEDEPNDEPVNGTAVFSKVDQKGNVITTGSALFQVYESQEEGAQPIEFLPGEEEGSFARATEESDDNVYVLETADGVLTLTNLDSGTYYLVEVKAPEGYALAGSTLQDATPFTIKRSDPKTTGRVTNEFISATVQITKADQGTQKPITGNPATFQLKDSEDNVLAFTRNSAGNYTYSAEGDVTDLVTATNGSLTLNNIVKGDYTLVETQAPAGYKISSAPVTLKVESNETDPIVVTDEPEPALLKIAKSWRLDGATKSFPLSGVTFELYKVGADGVANKVAEAETDAQGILEIEDFDWQSTYLVREIVPEGYVSAPGSVTTAYLNDETGAIDTNVTEPTEGYTSVNVIKLDPANAPRAFERDENGALVYSGEKLIYGLGVMNVKPVKYGGLFGSVSYKTVDNNKAVQLHEGLQAETGYGFNYTSDQPGERNFVFAVDPGDPVTYTLNVTNVSDYKFANMVIIDRLPETGDTGVVNLDEERGSEFTVSAGDAPIVVTVGGDVIDPSNYRVDYSDKVTFTDDDFNGDAADAWASGYADAKSMRITFADNFLLETGSTVVVTYDGVISPDAQVDQIAWNDFAYRYTATDGTQVTSDGDMTSQSVASGKVLTPEPPKVGVKVIDSHTVISGTKKMVSGKGSTTNKKEFSFDFTLERTDDLQWDVTYTAENGEASSLAKGDTLSSSAQVTLDGDEVSFEFPELRFKHTGKYEFDMREVIPEGAEDNGDGTYTLGDVVYDGRAYHVVVDGTSYDAYSNEDGIPAEYSVAGVEALSASFENQTSGDAKLVFGKSYYGEQKKVEFGFELVQVNSETAEGAWDAPTIEADEQTGEPLVGSAVSDPQVKTLTFEGTGEKPIEFKVNIEKDGVFYYLAKEIPNDSGVFDEARYLAKMTVQDGVPTTEYALLYPNGDGAFDNFGVQEEAPYFYNNDLSALSMGFMSWSMAANANAAKQVSVFPTALKHMNDDTAMLTGGDFTFELKDAEGTLIASTTNDETGRIAFFDETQEAGLVFTEPGVYEYRISEALPAAANEGNGYTVDGITYDKTVFTMTVTVESDAEGALEATVAYSGGDLSEEEMPLFKNYQDVIDLEVYKVSRYGGEGLEDCTYALWMVSEAGDVMIQEATSDATGLIVFKNVPLMKGQKYYFKEVAAPKGHTVDPYRTAYFTLAEDGQSTVLVEETAPDGWHSRYSSGSGN